MSRRLMLILALSNAPVLAAAFVATKAEVAACRRDALHFCREASEDDQVRDCLVAKKEKISSGCRAVLENHGY